MKVGIVGCGMVGSGAIWTGRSRRSPSRLGPVRPFVAILGGAKFAGVTFALPHLVHAGGALATIPPALDDVERASLQRSTSVLREAIGSLHLPGGG